jgi:hypothetical protein
MLLHLGQEGNYGNAQTKDQVDGNYEFAKKAATVLNYVFYSSSSSTNYACVEDVHEYYANNGENIATECEEDETAKTPTGFTFFVASYPILGNPMGKVHNQNQLDENEHKCADHSNPHHS